MSIEMDKIVRAAAEAVLEGQDSQPSGKSSGKAKRKRLTGPRALLIGAGVYTAGRLLVQSRGLVEDLQQRLVEFESRYLGGEQEDEDDEDFDEGEDLEADEEPEAEEDEEPEAEAEFDDDEEPEGDEDEEPEAEAEFEDEEPDEEFDDEEPEVDEESEPPRRTSSAAGRHNGRH